MIKLKRAVFCYYILRFDARLHAWLISIQDSIKSDSLLSIDDNEKGAPNWFTPLLDRDLDFDSVLRILSGDTFYERNRADVLKLQAMRGQPITELWDTDPIFVKFPHLKMLARNKEFEEMWAKMKSNDKSKQK